MAISSTYLSNPTLSINSVDLTDQCTSAVINYVAEQLKTQLLATRHAVSRQVCSQTPSP
jgi:hypothetical protein